MQDGVDEGERQAWAHDPATFYDYRREREFYKYYEPLRLLRAEHENRTPVVNIFDDDAVKAHVPHNRLNSTLTAFCQLGALRLRTRRCMLLFFDTESAYILAEATQTLSLQDDQVHDEEDGLWLGTVIIPRGLSLCEHTVNVPEASNSSDQNEPPESGMHIINNLTDDVRFCDRPFVTNGPKARFYAGIPIRTPSGHSIGAFCALDDKPRNGLSASEMDFMRQMSQNVIDHLEDVRTAAEYGRGSKMLTSIGTFFKTAPASEQSDQRTAIPNYGRQRFARDLRREQRSASVSTAASRTTYSADAPPAPDAATPEALHKEAIDVNDFASTPTAEPAPALSQSNGSVVTAVAHTSGDDEDDLEEALENNISSTFGTAADLIRTATNADGMVFLDVKSRAVEGRVRRRNRARHRQGPNPRANSETDGTSTDASYGTESDNASTGYTLQRCKVLGQSHTGTAMQSNTSVFPLKVIKLLLKRYSRGKVWNFNSEGVAAMNDSASDNTEMSDASVDQTEMRPDATFNARQKRSLREMDHIKQLFPGVRSLCFVPLWDSSKERVYAVGLMTTFSPHRVLSTDGELSFLRAFCDVVMANIGRLELSIEEQAKTQFISSISHELRSPLHGILGGIDFLHGQEKPDKTILLQIEKCATTLIEIIEHLLEYAKINNLTNQHTRLPGHTRGATQAEDRTYLARLTEDVADATFYSHQCAMHNTPQAVAYIYESRLDPIISSTVSVGAWKRLCMNVINNALKYTTQGYIKVSLAPKQDAEDYAQLIVEDTGIGMSREFLENGLFRAFRQENSLNPGTGLGMSLVAKLVKSIGGDIEVRSKKESGTTVKITVPYSRPSQPVEDKTLPLADVKFTFHENKAQGLGNDTFARRAQELQISAVKECCTQLGADLTDRAADYLFILDSQLAALSQDVKRSLLGSNQVLVLLCHDKQNIADLAIDEVLQSASNKSITVSQPFGPEKMAQVLRPDLSDEQRRSNPSGHDGVAPTDAQFLTGGTVLPMRPKKQSKQSWTEPSKSLSPLLPTTALPQPVPKTEQAALQPGKISESNKHRLPLLLVDDNPINLRILTMYATRFGHPYMTAANGKEAVEAYMRAFVQESGEDKVYSQVVFMDINMPIMSGFDATRQIRSFELAQGLVPTTVIALTGLGSSEAQQTAASCGIDLFLTKPVRTKELTRVLQTIAEDIANRSRKDAM